MGNKKPLKDWTLGELKLFCQENAGYTKCLSGCPFKSICDSICGEDVAPGSDVVPGDWDLTVPPRWTRDDIEDAKVVKRVCPWAVRVRRNALADRTIELIDEDGGRLFSNSDLFPSLKPGESVPLKEILDAEEGLNER